MNYFEMLYSLALKKCEDETFLTSVINKFNISIRKLQEMIDDLYMLL